MNKKILLFSILGLSITHNLIFSMDESLLKNHKITRYALDIQQKITAIETSIFEETIKNQHLNKKANSIDDELRKSQNKLSDLHRTDNASTKDRIDIFKKINILLRLENNNALTTVVATIAISAAVVVGSGCIAAVRIR